MLKADGLKNTALTKNYVNDGNALHVGVHFIVYRLLNMFKCVSSLCFSNNLVCLVELAYAKS